MARPIETANGVLIWEQLAKQIRPLGPHWAPTGLIEIENTHNMAGGTVYPQDVADDICDRAHEAGLPVHLDGARIFNAAVALGKPVAEITRKFDSVMFCLSKGLGAPVGSLLVGSKSFIEQARSVRKALGGGMRQAGILAAAGLIALEKMPARLHEDHANARLLAEGLFGLPGIEIDPTRVQTNIVIFDVSGTGMSTSEFTHKLAEKNLLAGTADAQRVRFVTHMDVNREACERALEAVKAVVGR